MSEMERIGKSGRAPDNLPEPSEAEVGGKPPSLTADFLAVAFKGALGAVPFAGSGLVEVVNRFEQRKQERRMGYVEETLRALGGDVELLKELLSSDEGLAELWLRGFTASEDARTKDKICLLAQVFVDASQGERSRISSAHVVLSAVASLEEVHLEVLADIRHLADQPAPTDGDYAGVDGAQPEALRERSRLEPDVLRIVLNDLAGKHMIRENPRDVWPGGEGGNEVWVLTPLGATVGRFLTVVATTDRDDEPAQPTG
jgi:hypothetical protein